jgi:hypothetical protein
MSWLFVTTIRARSVAAEELEEPVHYVGSED